MLIARGTAIISDCGKYRPWLTRDLGGTRPLVCIGANPSKADAMQDDQTMKKDQAYARRWGCGRLIKVNIYPWRATDPDDMWAAEKRGEDIHGAVMYASNGLQTLVNSVHLWRPDGRCPYVPTGPAYSNMDFIFLAIGEALRDDGIVLGAWGKIPRPDDVKHIVTLLTASFPELEIKCVATNQDGSPKHTLYTKLDLEPVPWRLP